MSIVRDLLGNYELGRTPVAEPSSADRAITLRLRDALELIDVRLLDHFVIGSGVPTSLAQRGWL